MTCGFRFFVRSYGDGLLDGGYFADRSALCVVLDDKGAEIEKLILVLYWLVNISFT